MIVPAYAQNRRTGAVAQHGDDDPDVGSVRMTGGPSRSLSGGGGHGYLSSRWQHNSLERESASDDCRRPGNRDQHVFQALFAQLLFDGSELILRGFLTTKPEMIDQCRLAREQVGRRSQGKQPGSLVPSIASHMLLDLGNGARERRGRVGGHVRIVAWALPEPL